MPEDPPLKLAPACQREPGRSPGRILAPQLLSLSTPCSRRGDPVSADHHLAAATKPSAIQRASSARRDMQTWNRWFMGPESHAVTFNEGGHADLLLAQGGARSR